MKLTRKEETELIYKIHKGLVDELREIASLASKRCEKVLEMQSRYLELLFREMGYRMTVDENNKPVIEGSEIAMAQGIVSHEIAKEYLKRMKKKYPKMRLPKDV